MEPPAELGGCRRAGVADEPIQPIGRILIIRGGAIGDFILTLPSLALIREGFPDCEMEVMGYPRVLPLVKGRPYADGTREIDYAPMAACFNPASIMDSGLADYFQSFDQIISYLYDPDRLFERSLRAAGVKNFLPAMPVPLSDGPHATDQLAAPLQSLALYLSDPCPRLHLAPEELMAAGGSLSGRVVVLHPGSGSPGKNWPVRSWLELAVELIALPGIGRLIVVGGEADEDRLAQMRAGLSGRPVEFLWCLPLRELAARLAGCRLFVGHDSGISHLAAAAGCPVLALFGPTDPAVWAPRGERVRVLGGRSADWEGLTVSEVSKAAREELER